MCIPYVSLMNLVHDTDIGYSEKPYIIFYVYKPHPVLLQIMVSTTDKLVKLLDALLIPCCHSITMICDLRYFFLLMYHGIYHMHYTQWFDVWECFWTHGTLNDLDHYQPLWWRLSLVWKHPVSVGNNNKVVPHWPGSSNCLCLKKAAL